ncbi:ankyrin repeat domain-containing protein [Candidatus Uabimicrobium amorphum]|uniref:UNC-44 ankyrin n=1 Tax=Uabimicrobium amorphum TaxID=2596890 RepID=A0A5S9IM72_UABAM|nr:ankyrin repeat domain-containing protein [Candidatus Uabimicrobium amorphum]BBM84100.1 UNC-44 ankyrin [Candidatus Uabimicrobium amorphum]
MVKVIMILSLLLTLTYADDDKLFNAVSKGNIKDVQELIASGANVKAEKQGWQLGITPLHIAAKKGHKDIAALLLEKGADIDARIKADNDKGQTALLLATMEGNGEVARLLFDKGAKTTAMENGYTLLHAASESGMKWLAEKLLTAKHEVDATDDSGNTPLFLAARYGKAEVAELLIANKANKKHLSNNGSSLLHYAANGGLLDLVNQLIAEGADHKLKNKRNETPFSNACFRGRVDVAKKLFSLGADIKDIDDYLVMLVEYGNKDQVEILCVFADHIDFHKKQKGLSLFHRAVKRGKKKLVKLLVEKGADVNEEITEGKYKGKKVGDLAKNDEISKILGVAPKVKKPKQVFHIVKGQGDFETNVSVIIYYRWTNDFFDKETHFKKLATIQTVDAPFPGGGVTGAQVYNEVAAVIKDKGGKIFARSVKNDPFTWKGSIEIKDAKNEYFNNYVCADKDGQLYMFLDLKKK